MSAELKQNTSTGAPASNWKPYPVYKDSGVEWLGKVPEHWDVHLLKRILFQIKDGTHGTYQRMSIGYPLLSAKNVFFDGIRIEADESLISKNDFINIVQNGFPKKNDLLLTIVGTIGRCYVYDKEEPLAFQRSVAFLRFNQNIIPKYYYFYFQSNEFFEHLQSFAKKSAQSGVYMNDVSETIVLKPSIEEQRTISLYLDDRTRKIDSLIEKKQKMIELLKEERAAVINQAVTKGLNPDAPMKHSGIEWLGEVPEKWEVKRLRNLLFDGKNGIKIGPFGSSLKTEIIKKNGIKVYGQENVIKDDFIAGNRYIDEEKFIELSTYEILPDDIVITMMGTTGKAKVVPKNIEKGIMDSHLTRIRVNPELFIPELVSLLINDSNYIFTHLKIHSKGSIMEGLNSSIIKSLLILVPPIKEQNLILNFIKCESAIINRTIFRIENEIELLQEYRTALISEVVTGKIDVREAI